MVVLLHLVASTVSLASAAPARPRGPAPEPEEPAGLEPEGPTEPDADKSQDSNAETEKAKPEDATEPAPPPDESTDEAKGRGGGEHPVTRRPTPANQPPALGDDASMGGALRSDAPPPKDGAPSEKKKLVEDLDVRVVGSVAFGAKYQSWPNPQGDAAKGPNVTFERIAFGLVGRYRGFVVNTDYRIYGKYGTLHHAYIGYRHKDVFEIDAGVHRVPFGILDYPSHNWFETIPYYLGLADDYDFGVKATIRKGGLNLQFGYYAQAEPPQFGSTSNSARYSYDIVRTDSTELNLGTSSPQTNEERHGGVARVAYLWQHKGDDTTEIGASGQFGGIFNRTSRRYGNRWAAVVHYNGWYRRFNVQFEAIYYQFNPQNPAGQPRTWITMGAWDAPYRVASEGFIAVANVGYRLPLPIKALDWIEFYNDHSILLKRNAGCSKSTGTPFCSSLLTAGKSTACLC